MRKIKSQSLSDEVKQEVLNYIKTSFDGKDNKLPTEDQFSEMLGVSRITIRTALNDLANEGIIFRRQGKGTFVNPQAVSMKVQFSPVTLFSDMIAQCGYKPTVKLLKSQISRADEQLADLLEIAAGDEVIVARKIFFADKKPCAYCEDYFASTILTDPSDMKLMNEYPNSLFDFLARRCNRKIEWDRTEILTVTNADVPELTEYFQCEDKIKSFLLLDCLNFDNNDRPVVYAKEYVDTNYIKFNSIRQKAAISE